MSTKITGTTGQIDVVYHGVVRVVYQEIWREVKGGATMYIQVSPIHSQALAEGPELGLAAAPGGADEPGGDGLAD